MYQVIGKNGPIFNPKNIKYLAPAASEAGTALAGSAVALAELAVGLNAATLAVGVGTLALSAATLHEIRKLSAKVDQILAWTEAADAKLDAILERVESIDIKVEENNLRHALDHLLRRAVSVEGVDLVELARLAPELQKFAKSCDGMVPGANLGLQLSADVRDKIEHVCSLLYSLRRVTYSRHNVSVSGDPEQTLRLHPVDDYLEPHWREWQTSARLLRLDVNDVGVRVAQDIRKRFTFASSGDVDHYRVLVGDACREAAFGEDIVSPFAWHSPEALQERMAEEEDATGVARLLRDYARWWLHSTDAGLLWRAHVETKAIGDGYEVAFASVLPLSLPAKSGVEVLDVNVSSSTADLVHAERQS